MNMNHDGNNGSTHLFILLTFHHCACILSWVTVICNEDVISISVERSIMPVLRMSSSTNTDVTHYKSLFMKG